MHYVLSPIGNVRIEQNRHFSSYRYIKLAAMTNTFILSALMLAREGASVTATDIR